MKILFNEALRAMGIDVLADDAEILRIHCISDTKSSMQ